MPRGRRQKRRKSLISQGLSWVGQTVRKRKESFNRKQMSGIIEKGDLHEVTCPMGRELFKLRDTKYGTEYSSREACRTCPNRCTDSKAAKHVNIGRHSTYVPVRMYGSSRFPLQQIPVNGISSKNLNNFEKMGRAEKRVMIFIRRDIPKQKQRQQTSEHPFGTIKHYDGAGYFLCKGKEKVTAEFALSCLGYDIRRAITICGGAKSLIQRFKGISLPKLPKMAEI